MSTQTLTADETEILRRLADGPRNVADLIRDIEPYPLRASFPDDDKWRTAVRRWGRRLGEIFAADSALAERGLTSGPERARQITEAGRGELARVDDAETAADGDG